MVEMIFALLLCTNGCLSVSLCDNLENSCLRSIVGTYSKVGLLIYPSLMLARMILYINVIGRARPEMTDTLRIYAEMFAVYISNDATQITVTSIVLVLYVVCFVICICILKCCNRLKKYLED